jgi:hypothetical protein
MINKSVKENPNKQGHSQKKAPERKPNELGGIHFSSHVRITDPDTKEVLLSKRGDD